MQRRRLLTGLGGAAALMAAGGRGRAEQPQLDPALPLGTRTEVELAELPGKHPLIKLSWRPPNYETPVAAFDQVVTPNEWFFVRYHLADIPEMSVLADWSLSVGGDAAERPYTLTLDELKSGFEQVELTGVCQCSGNRRGLFDPHVPGVEWGYGAMGNARWTGARLRDVLARAGVKPEAVELGLQGYDGPVLAVTPAFHKSIPIAKALEAEPLVAYAMNGAALPHLNGFPVRLIIPGWTGTYWVKHLRALEIRSKPLETFWMKPAYRVPRGMFPVGMPFVTQEDEKTTPITEMVVNSLITSPKEGAETSTKGFEVKGIAWDGGSGIRAVEISIDAGQSWRPAVLGSDLGRFSFRQFSLRVVPLAPGAVTVMARASSNGGQVQGNKLLFNPAGYQHNLIQDVTVMAT
jgi:sulfite dehydrogenase (cytochrome) subunit A